MSISEKQRSPSIFEFSQFSAFATICHFISGRNGGRSTGLFESMNLSYKVGDSRESVDENRNIIAQYLGTAKSNVLFPDQCHTGNVRTIKKKGETNNLSETDGLITNVSGICVAVLAADCVPVLLFDPVRKIVAAVHAGWRGTVANITGNALQLMKTYYNVDPANVIAGIGPSISWQNYEVGDEVKKQFIHLFGDNDTIIHIIPDKEKAHIDLWEANRELLIRNGVLKNNIEIAGVCTFDHSKDFFSARRDGISCGRFATGIMIK